MKFHILSDLHLRHAPMAPPAVVGDALLLAGDISDRGVIEPVFELTQHYRSAGLPVLYVPGNHEYYGRTMGEALHAMHRAFDGHGVTLLHNRLLRLGRIRVFGATLWTDYCLDGEARRGDAMQAAQELVADHRRIAIDTREGRRYFLPEDALAMHRKTLAILRRKLSAPWDGPTVVVTHHAPSPHSVHPRFAGHPANGAFVNDLEPLIRALRPQLWVHGHTHDGFDYRVGATRVIANPRGYPLPGSDASEFENPRFDADLVVEV